MFEEQRLVERGEEVVFGRSRLAAEHADKRLQLRCELRVERRIEQSPRHVFADAESADGQRKELR